MDFPVDLNSLSFINGFEEVKQTLVVLLQNQLGDFMQSPFLGSSISVHTVPDLIPSRLRTVVSQIPGLTLVAYEISLPDIKMSLVYNNREFQYNYNFSAE